MSETSLLEPPAKARLPRGRASGGKPEGSPQRNETRFRARHSAQQALPVELMLRSAPAARFAPRRFMEACGSCQQGRTCRTPVLGQCNGQAEPGSFPCADAGITGVTGLVSVLRSEGCFPVFWKFAQVPSPRSQQLPMLHEQPPPRPPPVTREHRLEARDLCSCCGSGDAEARTDVTARRARQVLGFPSKRCHSLRSGPA